MNSFLENAAENSYEHACHHIANNMLSSAKSCLLRAISYNDKEPKYYTLLGLVSYAMGEFAVAREYWMRSSADEYLSLFNKEDFLEYRKCYDLSIGYINEKKYINAAALMRNILKNTPNANGFRLLGLLFLKIGLKKHAVQNWVEALKINKEDHSSLSYILNIKEGKIPQLAEKVYLEVLLGGSKFKLL